MCCRNAGTPFPKGLCLQKFEAIAYKDIPYLTRSPNPARTRYIQSIRKQ